MFKSKTMALDKALDNEVLIERCKPALDEKKPVKFEVPIRNINRTVGTMVGAEISRKYGAKGSAGRHHSNYL